jgi:hypothetical protein
MRVAAWSKGAHSTFPCVSLSIALGIVRVHNAQMIYRCDIPIGSIEGHIGFNKPINADPLVI